MKKFVKDATLLFLALRAGDAVNLAAGIWFVPRFVSQEAIGAVLPVSSFATFLSLPLFALAMTVMKETAVLSAAGERGKIKTLLRGVFISAGAATVLTIAAAAIALPFFMRLMRIDDAAAGFLALAAALLGCAAPVWTDALQAMKRFRALAATEILGAAVRFSAMAAVMPVRALAGFFAGQAALPAFRIIAGFFALREDLKTPARPFWNATALRRMTAAFAAILVYQGTPMFISMMELSILRTALADADSAGYYMASRFSDLLHYLTLPILLVMFPYTADAAARGESTKPYVVKSSAAVLCAAAAMALVYIFAGDRLLPLLPNGGNYTAYAWLMPVLTATTALTSCQVFHTNAEVSAGRFGFLGWFLPLHMIYAASLFLADVSGLITSLGGTVACFAAAAAARFLLSAVHLFRAGLRNHAS